MRTTVNIADPVLRLARRRAEEAGVTLGEVISEAILIAYRERPSAPSAADSDLPESGEGGLQPGVDLDRGDALEDLLEGH